MRIPVSQSNVSLNPLTGYQAQPTYVRQASLVGAVAEPLEKIARDREHFDNLKAEEGVNQGVLAESEIWDEASQQVGGNVISKDGTPFADTYLAKLDDKLAKIGEGMTPSQRYQFSMKSKLLRDRLQTRLAGHEKKERTVYADSVYDGTMELEAANAVNAKGDVQQVTMSRMRVEDAFYSKAMRKGWSDEQKAVEHQKLLGWFYGGVIGASLDAGDIGTAKRYFEAHKGEIDPDMRDKMQTAITKKEAGLTVDTKADAIWKALGPKNDKEPVQLDKLLEQARQEENPDIRKALEAEIKDRAHTFDYSVRQRTDATVSNFFQDIEKGASWRQIKNDPKFMDLDGKTQNGLRKHYENERGITRDASAVPNNASAEYWKLVEQPDKLRAMSVDEIVAMTPTLGKHYREELLKRRQDLNNPKKSGSIVTDKDLLTTVYRSALNYRPERKLNTADNTALGELEVEMKRIQEASGATWSYENSVKLARELVKPVVTDYGMFGNTSKPLFQAIREVPESYFALVRKKAPNATDEQVARAYFMDKDKGLVD